MVAYFIEYSSQPLMIIGRRAIWGGAAQHSRASLFGKTMPYEMFTFT